MLHVLNDDTKIARLYRPIDTGTLSDDDDDEAATTQLLPTHHNHTAIAPKATSNKSIRLADVWDEREEIFGIGGESDDEVYTSRHHNGMPVPTISVTTP